MKVGNFGDNPLMEVAPGKIVLFYPYVPPQVIPETIATLQSRWIGQGPKVDRFEVAISRKFCADRKCVAVSSGTAALHLSYIAAGIKPGDEVISPVFTCTATNIPLLHMGAKIIFADIDPQTMNISVEHVKKLVTAHTRAIVCVDYGGCPCDLSSLRALADQHGIPLVEDASQSLGGFAQGKSIGSIADFTTFSFQAIKHITTGDGGMIAMKNEAHYEPLKRMRWFGIDRRAKQQGVWSNDITEIGYKYQMTDLGAGIGLSSLESFDEMMAERHTLFNLYTARLKDVPGITCTGANVAGHAAWTYTILAEKRVELQHKLREHGIEANQVHFRNDIYTIFGGRRHDLPNMDNVEDKYLLLPLHNKCSTADIERICDVIKTGW